MLNSSEELIHALATKLFVQNNKEDLEAVVERYPYFGFAHFLLLRNNIIQKDEKIENQLQKTALYFTNPYWLNFLIVQSECSSQKVAEIIVNSEEILDAPDQIVEPGEAEVSVAYAFQNNVKNKASLQDELETEQSNADEEDIKLEPENLSKLLNHQLSEFKKPIEDNEELFVKSSPYYTIDYFASQGIKLETAGNNKDQLETKVKKFTDWLKQIKRSNPQPTDLGTDTETEHMVETIAQTSNETKDVITEAMAEVLIKQGKKEKAILLYKKLSFLNPPKSTYFDAKIDELKDK